MAAIALLVISGPVGVGKTTLANELSELLERRGFAHSVVDLDGLAATYPRPADDQFGSRLALTNLREVWANCAAAGSRNLIIARVIETRHQLAELECCIPDSKAVVCQLRASDQTLIDRVKARELGTGRDWHVARALDLARSLQRSAPADFTVDTESRPLPDIAKEIAARVEWIAED